MKKYALLLIACLPLSLSAAPRGFGQILAEAAGSKYEMKESVKAGFVATIQKDGIGAISPGVFPNAYKNGLIRHLGTDLFLSTYGTIRNVGKPLILTDSGFIRDLSVNERVNVLSIDFVKGSLVVINIETTGGFLPARSSVSFQLGKPYLSSATPAQVEEIITNVFAPAPADAITEQIVPPPAPSQAEIAAALGQPLEINNLEGKVVYRYKKLKFTFVDGKVSDIE
jgi:hypothetical protein